MAEPHPGYAVLTMCYRCGEPNSIWRGVFNYLCKRCGTMNWIKGRKNG